MNDPVLRTLGAVLYPQFELVDLYGPLEMLGSLGERLRIVTVAERAGPVTSAQGPATVAEHDVAGAPKLDLLLAPGGVGAFARSATRSCSSSCASAPSRPRW
jgi:putative intracellular protease/amidase